MKFSLRALLSGALCALLAVHSPAYALSTSASAAVLMDAGSGRVLYEQNMTEERSIASITKLMTALVVAEKTADLQKVVEVDPRAVGVEGSSMYLARGEKLTMEALLYGLMLHSGNDAAVAVAYACAGDLETFVGWMNQKAAELGMAHSHFTNPNGLEEEGHYSCAYDMAILGREVLKNPSLAKIVSTKSTFIAGRSLTNHNKLLWRYEGCVGLKTGFTKKAGRTLVSGATRNGQALIAVTLNDGKDWEDHCTLLDYGFSTYHSHLLARGGKTVAKVAVRGALARYVPLLVAEDVRYCLTAEEQITARVELPRSLEAPIVQGEAVGTITYYLGGEVIGQTNLVTAVSLSDNRKVGLHGMRGVFYPLTLGNDFGEVPQYFGCFCQNLTT